MSISHSRTGPLVGTRIVELAGNGPGSMCAMLLADLGATVVRVDRLHKVQLGLDRPPRYNLLARNRDTIELDLKEAAARDLVLRLVGRADALIEGFRPGTMERLGLGPDTCLGHNPRLVYGRVTGWGQSGPLAAAAGHDINFIAVAGALGLIGEADGPPVPPLNLVGQQGGALFLALGLLAAMLNARATGTGQVVDAAIVDAVAVMMTSLHGLAAAHLMRSGRGTNTLDGGAYFYGTYACKGGGFVAVGAVEARLHHALLDALGIDPTDFPPQSDIARWPEARARLAGIFVTRTRDEWAALLERGDTCVSPVLSMDEARAHPHMTARAVFVEIDGVPQAMPAPRFARTPTAVPHPPAIADRDRALADWLSGEEIDALASRGAFGADAAPAK